MGHSRATFREELAYSALIKIIELPIWTDPSVVWGPTMSMGLGFYTTTPLPAESVTWGSIKALFE